MPFFLQEHLIPGAYKFDALITTFEMVLSDCPELREISWRCVIIDEAHRLKNRNCKLLDSLKMLDLVSGAVPDFRVNKTDILDACFLLPLPLFSTHSPSCPICYASFSPTSKCLVAHNFFFPFMLHFCHSLYFICLLLFLPGTQGVVDWHSTPKHCGRTLQSFTFPGAGSIPFGD